MDAQLSFILSALFICSPLELLVYPGTIVFGKISYRCVTLPIIDVVLNGIYLFTWGLVF